MDDRTLLELAAKAAGFGDPDKGRTIWTQSEYPRGSGLKGALWNFIGHMDTAELWNPLTDDGDALRLAVKLHLEITIEPEEVWAGHYTKEFPEGFIAGSDAYATTRRAIVLAAAEIELAKSAVSAPGAVEAGP